MSRAKNPQFTAPAIRRKLKEFSAHEFPSDCVAETSFVPTSETSGELTVVFQKRGTYIYIDFPIDEWLLFNNSSSRGTYFNEYIRDRYTFQKVA